jgi:hypothetical protein
LREGAECAVGVDLSERMIAIARQESRAEGFAVRTSYHQGDFTHVADRLADADVTVLDKVICCYPDRGRLVDPYHRQDPATLCLQHSPRQGLDPDRARRDALGAEGRRLLLPPLPL